jgi:hypothetical protein
MRIANRGATVVISIDRRCENSLGVQAHKNLDAASTTILGQLNEAGISATWGLESPADDPWARTLADRHPRHEIALLGDATWVGAGASRARFAGELTKRVTKARAIGIGLSSLVLTDTDLRADLDIAVKHGVTAVRPTSGQSGDPAALRFGLWRVPATLRLTESRRSLLFAASRTFIRAVDAAVGARGLCHVVIDTQEFSSRHERTIRQVLAHVARQRVAGRLAVKTLAGLVRDFTCSRQNVLAARSILREAA